MMLSDTIESAEPELVGGWWFGCHFWHFPINIGNFIIPIDVHIFQRGSYHQPVLIFYQATQLQKHDLGPWNFM